MDLIIIQEKLLISLGLARIDFDLNHIPNTVWRKSNV